MLGKGRKVRETAGRESKEVRIESKRPGYVGHRKTRDFILRMMGSHYKVWSRVRP